MVFAQKEHSPSWGCPKLYQHCYKKRLDKLVEIPLKGQFYETEAKGVLPVCRTRTNASIILHETALACEKHRAEYFSIGERPYASFGQMLPPISYLPGFRALPLYKINFLRGKYLPAPGDIVSTEAVLRHHYKGFLSAVRELHKTEKTCTSSFMLVCSNNPKEPSKNDKDDLYTGFSYPGCASNGWLQKCEVCPSLKELGDDFCRRQRFQFTHFVPQVEPKEL